MGTVRITVTHTDEVVLLVDQFLPFAVGYRVWRPVLLVRGAVSTHPVQVSVTASSPLTRTPGTRSPGPPTAYPRTARTVSR